MCPTSQSLPRDFRKALAAWTCDLYGTGRAGGRRRLLSVSPLARAREVTAGGFPVGFETTRSTSVGSGGGRCAT